jgi:hypothetical protein
MQALMGIRWDIQLANKNFILVHDAQWTGYEHIAFLDSCRTGISERAVCEYPCFSAHFFLS